MSFCIKLICKGLLAIVITYVTLLYVNILSMPLDYKIQKNLLKKIEIGNEAIRVSEITDFEWEEVCIIFPYQTPASIELSDGKDSLRYSLVSRVNRYVTPGFYYNNPQSIWWLVFSNKEDVFARKIISRYSPDNKYANRKGISSLIDGVNLKDCAKRDNAIIFNKAIVNKDGSQYKLMFFGEKI